MALIGAFLSKIPRGMHPGVTRSFWRKLKRRHLALLGGGTRSQYSFVGIGLQETPQTRELDGSIPPSDPTLLGGYGDSSVLGQRR